ncbi:bb3-type cytochrome oxidase subunit III [Undibacterium sp. TJN25]|uniref:bb3-type cytochrome oxidase subunit III n=1 Tax=Undibacterium sp. TJN25 TaxID=3413056 RepID=UPI003BF2201D
MPRAPYGVLPEAGRAALSVALGVFMLVAGALFSLFMAAYVMRMTSPDWSPVGMPWQLWLSSACLLAGSLALQLAAGAAGAGRLAAARLWFMAGGGCALAFLLVQLWAWQVLLAMQVRPAGNPAGSFFYLLTAMHGLHVVGGLVCWMLAARFAWRSADAAGAAWRMRLCARYWHFLLLAWVALFAALNWLSPEFVRYICGIPP